MPVGDRGRRVRRAPIALLADIVCVIVFCTIGRRSHAEGLTVAGIAQTAWPFLAGTGVGWLLIRGWRQPITVIPTGVVVWVCTVVVGMLLRKATSAGVAGEFRGGGFDRDRRAAAGLARCGRAVPAELIV